jgi:hypothetical protein
MRIEALILSGQVVVFFLVHLLIDDILLSDTQCTPGTLLMDFRSSPGGLNPSFQTAVTAARGGNVGTA